MYVDLAFDPHRTTDLADFDLDDLFRIEDQACDFAERVLSARYSSLKYQISVNAVKDEVVVFQRRSVLAYTAVTCGVVYH